VSVVCRAFFWWLAVRCNGAAGKKSSGSVEKSSGPRWRCASSLYFYRAASAKKWCRYTEILTGIRERGRQGPTISGISRSFIVRCWMKGLDDVYQVSIRLRLERRLYFYRPPKRRKGAVGWKGLQLLVRVCLLPPITQFAARTPSCGVQSLQIQAVWALRNFFSKRLLYRGVREVVIRRRGGGSIYSPLY
jgi:hypothetical protein